MGKNQWVQARNRGAIEIETGRIKIICQKMGKTGSGGVVLLAPKADDKPTVVVVLTSVSRRLNNLPIRFVVTKPDVREYGI